MRLTAAELALLKPATVPSAFLVAADETVERRKGDCLAEFRRGAMAVAFLHLREGPDAAARRAAARTAIEDRLRCSPADGNAWLLLADISARETEGGDRAAALLQASRYFSPHEGWIVQRRLAWACNFEQPAIAAVASVAASDFTVLLTAEEFRRAAALYETCRKDMLPALDTALSLSSLAVRQRFARAVAASLPTY